MSDSNRIDNDVFVSPFLNFDPSVLVSGPSEQFIFPEGEKHRGRFERSFSEIGVMAIGGATVGGVRGLYCSFFNSEIKKLPTLAIRRTQILNHVTKAGSTLAQTSGSIGLIYALTDFLIHKLRKGADDEINTVTAATTTGCLYRSPGLLNAGGWQRCLRGGVIGLGFGGLVVTFTSWSKIRQMLGG